MSNSTSDPFRHRVAEPFELTECQKETLVSILDVFVAHLPKEQEDALVEKLKETHTEEEVREFCQISSSSLNSIEATCTFINHVILPPKRTELLKFLSLLSTRPGTFLLTKHFNEFKNLSWDEREKIILNWKDSYLPKFRGVYKTFQALACHPAYRSHSDVFAKGMHYDLKKEDGYVSFPEKLPMMKLDEVQDDMHFDAIVVGSGAGGGVVASQLAQAGKSVLVIEKGKYYSEEEFINNELDGFTNLYEQGGFSPTLSGSVSILTGSVFGGGTTVNWSASLKLQHFAREEWAKQGLTHFISPKFTEDLDKVFERIGATTSGIKHNGPNQVLVDGCKVLGYPVADVPQNTGGKAHDCHFCFCGCRAGVKNGSMNSWLRDAYDHHAKFLDKTKVKRVLMEDGKAVGIECLVHYEKTVRIKADQVIISGGTFQSPGVLLRSGLKNKNIGRNLHVHPVAAAFGYFDRKIRPFEGSIMTAISSVVENTENDGYGAKIYVPSLHPGAFSTVVPWRGAAAHKEAMLRYDQCAPVIIIARDKDSQGSVTYDKDENVIVDYTLSNRDRRSLHEGIVRSIDILVAAGAREVQTSQFGVEPFKFETSEESRIDNPRYIAWKSAVIKYGFPDEGSGVYSAHQMGTNRMGISPRTSVVKPTGETWEVKNLYVADASVFPTASGVNPMVTTEAVALHIADCIIKDSTKSKF
ncbi:hypothetical protein G6F37_001879 [Rhizopus arrhizus]|nr:hypothetical protein G6F38_002514 [Rhizopus arrhizus]KAG1162735.1 hypothetical protein G6F37_001879 [Rhizopus arrhizus]